MLLIRASKYTEAVVVIANGEILKAQANPYMCKDRSRGLPMGRSAIQILGAWEVVRKDI